MSKQIEAEVEVQEQKPDDARDNEAYFWDKTADPESLAKFDFFDRRHMVDALIWVQLEPFKITAEPTVASKLALAELKDWKPKTRVEALAAAGDRFARKSLRKAKSFHQDALADIKISNQAMVALEDEDSRPEARLIRANPEVLYSIADYLMAKEATSSGNWGRKNTAEYKERQKYWRGLVLAAAKHGSDEVLLKLFNLYRQQSEARLRYWTQELPLLQKAAGQPAVKESVTTVRQIEVADAPPEPEVPKKSEPFDINNYIPPEHQAILAERQAAFEAEVERLDHAGMPETEKWERVYRMFPEFRPLEQQFLIEQREEAKQRGMRPPTSRHRRSAAQSPGVRRSPAYDKRPDK